MDRSTLAWMVAIAVLSVPLSSLAQERASGNDEKSSGGVAIVPADYVIGVEDVLVISFWRDADMSAEVVVRPDGKISLPLLNDVQAAGLTPEGLRAELEAAAAKYVAEPNATVVIKDIRSRKVYVTGQVAKPGTYDLAGGMNVLQLIASAGGLLEYADSKNIRIIRQESGKTVHHRFNYRDVVRQKNVGQNILLKPGDTVVIP
jgi:polysaccharide biosynthesis/export protein